MDNELYILELGDGTGDPRVAHIGGRAECIMLAEVWRNLFDNANRVPDVGLVATWGGAGRKWIAMVSPISRYQDIDWFNQWVRMQLSRSK